MSKLDQNLVKKLLEADKRAGLPPGTMQGIMSKEIGGQELKYLTDPTAYHYEPNAQGKRIAKHTGKESTAFGPFGILDSTARDPGYGVTPLKDKSFDEQLRFATDYLAARSQKAGSLRAGIAGYGEGKQYADAVVGRVPALGGADTAVLASPTRVASVVPVGRRPDGSVEHVAPETQAVPNEAPVAAPVAPVLAQGPVPLPPHLVAYLESRNQPDPVPQAQNAWGSFLQNMQVARGPAPVQPEEVDYTGMLAPVPQMQAAAMAPRKVDFSPFAGFSGRIRRA